MSKIDEIHKAALKVINEQGLSGAPVSRIAREAGVAAGTMYVYYKSKDELLISLYKSILEGLNTSLEDAVEGDLAERPQFYKLWLAAFKYYLKNPEGFLFVRQFSVSPKGVQAAKEKMMKGYEPMVKVIEAGQKKGLLKKMSLPVCVAIVSRIIEATIDIQLSGSFQLSGDLLQDLLDSTWRMLEKV